MAVRSRYTFQQAGKAFALIELDDLDNYHLAMKTTHGPGEVHAISGLAPGDLLLLKHAITEAMLATPEVGAAEPMVPADESKAEPTPLPLAGFQSKPAPDEPETMNQPPEEEKDAGDET